MVIASFWSNCSNMAKKPAFPGLRLGQRFVFSDKGREGIVRDAENQSEKFEIAWHGGIYDASSCTIKLVQKNLSPEKSFTNNRRNHTQG